MGSGDADRQQAGRGALPAFAKSWEGKESGRRFVCCVSSQSVPRLRYDGRAVTPLCAWLLLFLVWCKKCCSSERYWLYSGWLGLGPGLCLGSLSA
jgi:hypothetical protein